ncbi:MAG: methyl-accepting chemotaxis protein, partial [Alteromonadaceae bacterium]
MSLNNFLNNLTLKIKLVLSFGLIAIGVCALGAISYYKLGVVSEISLSVANIDAKQVFTFYELKDTANQHRMKTITHVGTPEMSDMERLAQEVETLDEQISKIVVTELAKAKDDKVLVELLKAYQQEWQVYKGLSAEIIENSKSFFKEDALALVVGDSFSSFTASSDKLAQIIKDSIKTMQSHANEAGDITASSKGWIIGSVLFMVVFSIVAGVFMAKSITGPVNKLLFHFREFAEGKLRIDC